MNEKIHQRYLETSVYTYVGMYKEFILSLPNDIPTIGRLICDQITHPSMYFTEPSSYLENTYFGKFSSYPKPVSYTHLEVYKRQVWDISRNIASIIVTNKLSQFLLLAGRKQSKELFTDLSARIF